MNAEHSKSASSINRREFQSASTRSSGSFTESETLRPVLEQVRNALVRLEIELKRLEAILHTARLPADQEQQERVH